MTNAKRTEERAAVPACVLSMGCLCAGHARGNAGQDACDTSETSRDGYVPLADRLELKAYEAIQARRYEDAYSIADELRSMGQNGMAMDIEEAVFCHDNDC